ncbi:hypothetical protein AVEN_172259-1 [Araneus ventricosus]|uniref:Uncharacterized protein n=1 Tax=Araneus ventricosus TaxID=182803 RepID=A0A4Y2KI43_ARAVE|nr:hypothetical protein AVEN_172259-1 [Araneus ventricosus]
MKLFGGNLSDDEDVIPSSFEDETNSVMFGYRWRWLIGRLAQLLASLGLLSVNESVGVTTSRSEVRYLGLVVVVIFGIALVFSVQRTTLYLLCVLLVLYVSKSQYNYFSKIWCLHFKKIATPQTPLKNLEPISLVKRIANK